MSDLDAGFLAGLMWGGLAAFWVYDHLRGRLLEALRQRNAARAVAREIGRDLEQERSRRGWLGTPEPVRWCEAEDLMPGLGVPE